MVQRTLFCRRCKGVSHCDCGFYTLCYDHMMCVGGEEGGFYVCGYVLIRMSKMGLCVSVCMPFNCNAFLVKLHIWNRSRGLIFVPSSQYVRFP
jgi:hypothetical protein